nr:hypothetical protein [uncultured bacterium]
MNGTVGVSPGNTCTVTVNVTPNVAGPFNNRTGRIQSTYGIGNQALATLATNLPPIINLNPITLKADSNPSGFTIGTASDPDDPNHAPNTLGIKINGGASATSNGVTVNNLVIAQTGTITADISATCAAQPGNTTFSLAVTDSQGAIGTGTLTVTITPETTKPVIVCTRVAAQTASADANCSAPVPDVRALVQAQSSDNCTSGASLIVTQSPAQGTSVGFGSHPITVTVTDANNNSETCIVGFTVNDTQPPVITCPANKSAGTDANQCSAAVTYALPSVSDHCSGVGVPQCNPPSGSVFPKGTTTVTCTVSDTAGNQASCSFTITVNDTQPPSMTCPANIVRGNDANLLQLWPSP